jgi:hypothetical protein
MLLDHLNVVALVVGADMDNRASLRVVLSLAAGVVAVDLQPTLLMEEPPSMVPGAVDVVDLGASMAERPGVVLGRCLHLVRVVLVELRRQLDFPAQRATMG